MFKKFGIFITGKPNIEKTFLDDKSYGLALNTFVKVCCDIIFTNDKNEVLLCKRKILPQNDYWVVGGRCYHGTDIFDNVKRISDREIGIDINKERFKLISFTNYIWGLRQQYPQNNGTSDLVSIFKCELNNQEILNIKLDSNEYEHYKWVDINLVNKSNYHPAIKFNIKCIEDDIKLEKLKKYIINENKDEVLKLCKELFVN